MTIEKSKARTEMGSLNFCTWMSSSMNFCTVRGSVISFYPGYRNAMYWRKLSNWSLELVLSKRTWMT